VDAVLWVLALSALGGILLFSVESDPPVAVGRWDKLAHAGAYAAMTGAFLLALSWRPGRGDGPAPRAGIVIVLAAMTLGIVLELVQASLVGRRTEVADALSDATGIAAAWTAWRFLRARAERAQMSPLSWKD
jgi:VanZ family protein